MAGTTIDFDKIEQEVSQLSEEQVREALVKMRVSKIKTQKAAYNPATAKAYRDRKNAEYKLLVEKAKALGIHDDVMERAKELAAEQIGVAQAEADE